MVLCLTPYADITEWVLNDGLEDIRWLHSNLLREATVTCISCCSLLHVELVDDNFEDVKIFSL